MTSALSSMTRRVISSSMLQDDGAAAFYSAIAMPQADVKTTRLGRLYGHRLRRQRRRHINVDVVLAYLTNDRQIQRGWFPGASAGVMVNGVLVVGGRLPAVATSV